MTDSTYKALLSDYQTFSWRAMAEIFASVATRKAAEMARSRVLSAPAWRVRSAPLATHRRFDGTLVCQRRLFALLA